MKRQKVSCIFFSPLWTIKLGARPKLLPVSRLDRLKQLKKKKKRAVAKNTFFAFGVAVFKSNAFISSVCDPSEKTLQRPTKTVRCLLWVKRCSVPSCCSGLTTKFGFSAPLSWFGFYHRRMILSEQLRISLLSEGVFQDIDRARALWGDWFGELRQTRSLSPNPHFPLEVWSWQSYTNTRHTHTCTHTYTHARDVFSLSSQRHAFCVQMRHIQRLLIYKETACLPLCPASIKSEFEGAEEKGNRLTGWSGKKKKKTRLFHAQSDKVALSPHEQMEDITGIILLMLISSRRLRGNPVGSLIRTQTSIFGKGQKEPKSWQGGVFFFFSSMCFVIWLAYASVIKHARVHRWIQLTVKAFVSTGMSLVSQEIKGMLMIVTLFWDPKVLTKHSRQGLFF